MKAGRLDPHEDQMRKLSVVYNDLDLLIQTSRVRISQGGKDSQNYGVTAPYLMPGLCPKEHENRGI